VTIYTPVGYVNPAAPRDPAPRDADHSSGVQPMAMSADQTASAEQLRARLRRIEGQVRGISKMLDSDRSCEEVITQLMAVRSSLDTVGALLLDNHLGACLGSFTPDEQVHALREAMRLWWRFAPSAGAMGAAPNELGAFSPLPQFVDEPHGR